MLDLLKFDISARNRASREFDRMRKDLKGVRGALVGVSDYAQRAGRNLRNIGLGLSVGVTAPISMIVKSALQAAKETEEAQSMFDQVFGRTAAATRDWSQTLAREIGRSKYDLQEQAAEFQQILGKMAPDTSQAAEMSRVLAGLSQDLSSFFNTTEADAAGKLRAGLIGEAEPLRRFGVLLSAATVEQKALELGLAKTSKGISEQDKVLARYRIILDQTRAAQGDAARTSESLTNKGRALEAAFKDLRIQMGTHMIPIMAALTQKAVEVVSAFGDMSPEAQKWILVSGVAAAAAGPLMIALGGVMSGVSALTGALYALAPAVWAALGPWGVLAGALGATAGYFLLVRDNADTVKTPMEQAEKAQNALTGALRAFSRQAAPAAGSAAINAVNDYYQMAQAAREAAASNLAMLQSELAVQEGINNGLKFGNFFGDKEASIIAEDMAAARGELAKATRMLELAESQRRSVASRVMGSDVAMKRTLEGLNPVLDVTAEKTNGLAKALGGAAPKARKLNLDLKATEKRASDLAQAARGVDKQWGAAFSSIIRGSESMGGAVSRVLDSMADQIFSNAFTSLLGSVGFGSLFAPLVASANGNVFSSGRVQPFAAGGVVNGPTVFPMRGGTGLMGEAGPEAIMPLTRINGKLGVKSENGGRQDIHITLGVPEGVTIEDVQGAARVEVQKLAPSIVNQAVRATGQASRATKTLMGIR